MENKEFVNAMAEDNAENQIRLEVCGGGIAFITLTDPKLSLPSPRIYAHPADGAFPGIGSEACRQSHHSHRGSF
ncbi:unnamed protein product [Sphagnum jensenii]|uniref:Uncharacterized protein n=1 Tax=Sphagnum jensenii TaxID=128206 RepID=A0ABP0X642_9BRYO